MTTAKLFSDQVAEATAKPEPIKAPACLSKPEKLIWDRVIQSSQAGIGPEQIELLTSYCRHFVNSENVARMKADFEKDYPKPPDLEGYTEWVQTWDRLARAYSRETSALVSIATKLRLSLTSFRDAEKEHIPESPAPWLKQK